MREVYLFTNLDMYYSYVASTEPGKTHQLPRSTELSSLE